MIQSDKKIFKGLFYLLYHAEGDIAFILGNILIN